MIQWSNEPDPGPKLAIIGAEEAPRRVTSANDVCSSLFAVDVTFDNARQLTQKVPHAGSLWSMVCDGC